MENKAESIVCNDLTHVICLPFNIAKPDNSPPGSLDAVAESLKDPPWKEGATPDNEEPWGEFRAYQARAYFHPFVRRFLHNRKQVRRYHRTDIKQIKADLGHWTTGEFTLLLRVLRCELILFQPDIGVLLLEVAPQSPLSLRKAQLLLDSLRRLYPPYVDCFGENDDKTWFGGHCPVAVTLQSEGGAEIGKPGIYRDKSFGFMTPYQECLLRDPKNERPAYPWAEHWRSLLAPFVCYGEAGGQFRAQQLGDDRTPIFSWIAFDDPRAVDRGNWMRLCFADAPGDDCLPYAHAFTGDFEEKYCYDRYWYEPGESSDAPSRILNCGYAFCFAGSSQDTDFFTNKENGAHATFRHIYVEMGLIAHFQKAALLSMSQRLGEMVSREGKDIHLPDQKEVRAFYDHFVEFTQNFWFDEITPQQQGQELFQKWHEHLRIQDLYDEVRQELKDLVDYSELRAAGELNDKLSYVAVAGFLLAFLSLLAGILGMNRIEGVKDLSDLIVWGLVLSFGLGISFLFIAWERGYFRHNRT
ncbi:MAG: hypothetical protein KJ558_04535 [Gammaproteobacteria bacterium]|nr:hypothetical protein [Gammaproteobacteria bacterium]MBU1654088.1 hypothetical protein [Gammaproteobacteria bacterium]MBU1961369.1 hypothetical protein [Gammaproteobacteria bacterium]